MATDHNISVKSLWSPLELIHTMASAVNLGHEFDLYEPSHADLSFTTDSVNLSIREIPLGVKDIRNFHSNYKIHCKVFRHQDQRTDPIHDLLDIVTSLTECDDTEFIWSLDYEIILLTHKGTNTHINSDADFWSVKNRKMLKLRIGEYSIKAMGKSV